MYLATSDLAWQVSWNWTLGWSLVIVGFVGGALLGLGFHREAFLGGYQSFERRLLRLGHIACIALGGVNLLWAIAPLDAEWSSWGGACWAIGGVLMPTVCALTAWRPGLRHLFCLPVISATAGALIGLLS